MLENGKNEDLTWCSKKIDFRKYKSKIIDASIFGERAINKIHAKVFIKIYRADKTSTEHVHTTLDTFGYYEWLEISEVIVNEKSSYKKYVIEELTRLLNKMGKLHIIPPL